MTTAHEPRRGPGTHLSEDELSALAEGAEPGAEGVTAHLEDCDDCRAEVDALSELLAAFETLEAPVLPQEVALRIDAALARESQARAAGIDLAENAALSADVADAPMLTLADLAETAATPNATTLPASAAPLPFAATADAIDTTADQPAASISPASGHNRVRPGTDRPTNDRPPKGDAAVRPGGDTAQRPQSRPRRSRRMNWRGVGWGLASLVLLAGGLTLAADLTSSTAGSSASSASGTAQSGRNPEGTSPLAQRGIASGEALAATSPLAIWAMEILPARSLSATKSGSGAATDVPASPCLTNPRFTGYKLLASADGTYQGNAATLVVYANGSDTSTVYAVAYSRPCTTSYFPVLAEGIVTR